MWGSSMNHRQQLFINAYLINGNATQSAIEAGYSARTAHVQGSRLLKHPEVKEVIENQRQIALEESQLVLSDLIAQLESVRRVSMFKSPAIALKAVMAKAKLLGYLELAK